jgi:hypothetical protein
MQSGIIYHGTDKLFKIGDVLKADPMNSSLRFGVFATNSLLRAQSMALRAALKKNDNYVVFFHFRKNKFFMENIRKNISRYMYIYILDETDFVKESETDFVSCRDVKIKDIIEYDIIDFIKQENMEIFVLDDEFDHSLLWEEKHKAFDNYIDQGKYKKLDLKQFVGGNIK